MKSLAKASRVNKALQVIQLMNEGVKIVDACQNVGIARSSYYYIVQNNPDAIAEIQEIINVNQREQLALLLQTKMEMLQKVIADGLSETTKPKERLAIYLKLDEYFRNLEENLQMQYQSAKIEQQFLFNGPEQHYVESRFSASPSTSTAETDN